MNTNIINIDPRMAAWEAIGEEAWAEHLAALEEAKENDLIGQPIRITRKMCKAEETARRMANQMNDRDPDPYVLGGEAPHDGAWEVWQVERGANDEYFLLVSCVANAAHIIDPNSSYRHDTISEDHQGCYRMDPRVRSIKWTDRYSNAYDPDNGRHVSFGDVLGRLGFNDDAKLEFIRELRSRTNFREPEYKATKKAVANWQRYEKDYKTLNPLDKALTDMWRAFGDVKWRAAEYVKTKLNLDFTYDDWKKNHMGHSYQQDTFGRYGIVSIGGTIRSMLNFKGKYRTYLFRKEMAAKGRPITLAY
jgi:hypothetical protein